jgi:hypothetical protein
MKKDNNLPEKSNHKPVSKNAIYQKVSGYAYDAIKVLVDVMNNGDNDNAKVGAAKTLLSKCAPDLKATELDLGEKTKFIIQLVKEIPLDDRKENPTTNKELSKPADNI